MDENGSTTNIVHDAVGGSILQDNGLTFEKILMFQKGDIIYCDKEESLLKFDSKSHLVTAVETKSKRCDFKSTGKGLGKFFAQLRERKKLNSQKKE